MRKAIIAVVAPLAVAAVSACGEALGPDDSFDMIGTWEAKATPTSTQSRPETYDCHVEDLTLIITPPPPDSAWQPPGSFSGTTSGGAAKCLSWRRNPLPPGVVWGRAFIAEDGSMWQLRLHVYIAEGDGFQLGVQDIWIESTSHIEGLGTMGGGGVYIETPFGDVYTFYVNVTLTRR
jgi:hypothetical protein